MLWGRFARRALTRPIPSVLPVDTVAVDMGGSSR
jgi:hypothetical protein